MPKYIRTESPTGRVGEVYSWASVIDEGTIEQATRLSRSYAVVGHVALMPDAHVGNGATIGSVVKTAASIIPAAVGVDIGCGVIAARVDIKADDLNEQALKRTYAEIRKAIPAGMGGAHEKPIGLWEDFEFFNPVPGRVRKDAALYQRAAKQFGTLGDGNHFVELAKDGLNNVWVIIHSGSRGVGNLLAEESQTVARNQCEADGYKLEDPNLSWLVAGTTEFNTYIEHMLWAQRYAYNQRVAMLHHAVQALGPGVVIHELYNCHHNYAENIDGDTWLTRKGAINASKGQYGLIPGSMATGTFLVRGLGNELSYNSAPHGAGRLLSRGMARRQLNEKVFKQEMEGILWQDRNSAELLDEAPSAYKPINTVMNDASDLVEPVAFFTQIANYKGTTRKKR